MKTHSFHCILKWLSNLDNIIEFSNNQLKYYITELNNQPKKTYFIEKKIAHYFRRIVDY